MVDASTKPLSSSKNDPLKSCLAQMHVEAKNEASETLSESEIDRLGEELWSWSQEVDDKAVRIRKLQRSRQKGHAGHLLEAAGPDRPFLVDSILGACSDLGFEVHTLFHPIIETKDGNRSLIQVHLPELSENEQADLLAEVERTLDDVVLATSDYQAMRKRMEEEAERLASSPHVSQRYKDEAVAFLKWLGNERFVFLGARSYTFQTAPDGTVLPEEPDMVEGSNLGLLRDENRNVLNRGAEPLLLTEEIGAFLSEPESLILAKATLVSRVHRRVTCDYIGVKHYNENGTVIGETRFLGLYTSEAYNESVKSIPLLRRRVDRVIELLGAVKDTHNEKALTNIMESWPRDELIQTKSETLAPIMQGVLHLIGRPRVRLFVRPDRYNRFVSVIVLIPRERYDTNLRQRIGDVLEKAWKGRLSAFQPSFEGPSLVRVLFQIDLPKDTAGPDVQAIEAEIAQLARSWNDHFRDAVMSSDLDKDGQSLATLFTGAFNAAYREAFSPQEAMTDVAKLAELSAERPVSMRAFRWPEDNDCVLRGKIYSRSGSIPLSDCVPILERMGLFVSCETGYPVTPGKKPVEDAPETYWVHSVYMQRNDRKEIDLDAISAAFEQAFVAVWSGWAENDGFNALILNAGLSWREAALARALCAYRHQSGLDPARQTQIEALNTHAKLTRQLIELFKTRFGPDLEGDRAEQMSDQRSAIEEGLKSVSSLDHDRIIRRVANLIMAIQRTNYFQRNAKDQPRKFISFKIASRDLDDLPAPKPYREIFMSSPQVEGVHCRFGAVARGGLRWSDRRDDYRTEVLGLVKAQQVKNAVIVPVGSKGGFYPKQLPAGGSREEIRDAGTEAYKTFITSLLDLTDNLIDGDVQHPDNTVIHDGEDPYLVVAADKGTATFSDIANEISQAHGFWLGDAFASGGSAGYDHKKMGITARGAWEAVKRHFREMGKDIQSEPFTVIGCGDMSGDVFGNGMLLSKHIRLQAAFNHMHVFVDPDPQDAEKCWNERKRLFDLPRSSWTDYDKKLISKGGGIFERSAKSIELSDEIKALTGLRQDEVTPDELIHALLKSECELLWFGGIGTYIKANHESHSQAGDRSNDGLRVNGKELKAKVIGEGANLGLTQAGRIEAAQNGVRLNTDAIDNSAGVDSSDHEVNIKILCTEAMRRGALPSGERNTLLASMTDDVADHVLAHNYAQTAALSLAAQTAQEDHDALERLMVKLEQRGVLDRKVEGLPSTAEMSARRESNLPLTRPEIAVLMAWTKIVVFDDLVESDVPDDPWFHETLQNYFPEALHQYDDAMQAHRLKREIIATVLANRIIDVSGPVFLLRLREQTSAENSDIVAGFETARHLIQASSLQEEINALDNQVPAERQLDLQRTLAEALSSFTQSMLNAGLSGSIEDRVSRLKEATHCILQCETDDLAGYEKTRAQRAIRALCKDGIETELGERFVRAGFASFAPLIIDLASIEGIDNQTAYRAFLVMGHSLSLDRLRIAAGDAVANMPYWDRLATRRLIRELELQQSLATEFALKSGSVADWLKANGKTRSVLLADIKTYTASSPNFAQFALAGDAVRKFMQSVSE